MTDSTNARSIADRIEETVTRYAAALARLSPADLDARRAPGKWSRKEILGHLLDSAQNNIQRFVRGQYEDNPKIVYAQDEWVRLQGYQHYDGKDLLQLWLLLNRHLCRVVRAIDPAGLERTCNTGATAVELRTLSFLANDYLAHMIRHLEQLELNE
jgi:uncharacterized damage-inducible protein DinB